MRRRLEGEEDCIACLGTGILPPGTRAVRVCDCRTKFDLEGHCKAIALKMERVNPDWHKKMNAAMEEHHWTYTQAVGACIAYVYERGLHMTIPRDEFFREGTPDTPTTEYCALEGCGKAFTPRWPQDKFCSNECGVKALPKRKVQGQPVVPPMPDSNPKPITEGTDAAVAQFLSENPEPLALHNQHDEFADG